MHKSNRQAPSMAAAGTAAGKQVAGTIRLVRTAKPLYTAACLCSGADTLALRTDHQCWTGEAVATCGSRARPGELQSVPAALRKACLRTRRVWLLTAT